MTRLFYLVTLSIALLALLAQFNPVNAQSSEYDKVQTLVNEEGQPVEQKEGVAPVTVEDKLLGRVVAIELGGAPSTKPEVILNQLTFKTGEVVHQSDIALSYKRLYQLGLFWYVKMRYEPVSDTNKPEGDATANMEKAPEGVGDIVVYVDVWQGISYYGFPYTTGAIIGDKDIFLSGKTVEAAYFQSGKDFRYWHAMYADPQFMGSHHNASFIISHLKDLYGVRSENTYDFGERYLLDRDSYKFSIDTLYKENYRVNWGVEWQNNDTAFRNGTIFSDTNKFFLSDEVFDPGTAVILNASISEGKTKGYPWTYDGYTWSMGTDQAVSGLGSDQSFGKYKLKGTVYFPVESIIDTAVLHGEYTTTSGNPPHYQKPRLGYMMRGHEGLDYFGESTLFLSGEIRKSLFEDKCQGVAFIDLGKGFDKRTLSFENLDFSAGIGIRVDTSKFVRLPFILRLDYAWGPEGTRVTYGIGQWFY